MNRILLWLIPMVLAPWGAWAQKDTTATALKEVIVLGKHQNKAGAIRPATDQLEQFLDQHPLISGVKRGGYAWEPQLNFMGTERTAIAIDGMRLFGACTDKMDPITSYITTNQMSQAEIQSGQWGASLGPTLGGSLDLGIIRPEFHQETSGIITSGWSSNHREQVQEITVNTSGYRWALRGGYSRRAADAYSDGNGTTVDFSQYSKQNASLLAAYRWNAQSRLDLTLIIDDARDVGYPALPMDVSFARALIGALDYEKELINSYFDHFEAKLYANSIEHAMDDTTRPDVPIHMDMPGWSDTYGYSSTWHKSNDHQEFTIKWHGYFNRSLAEMTMYPKDPEEELMFMETWPGVENQQHSVFVQKNWHKDSGVQWGVQASQTLHREKVGSDFGWRSLSVFYRDVPRHQTRWLSSFSGMVELPWSSNWNASISGGYGERAPSVSEAYGFYLFNSMDGFDYIGNPHLGKESSWDMQARIQGRLGRWTFKSEAHGFYLTNFIAGRVAPEWAPMTIGARGIKTYEAMDHAKTGSYRVEATYSFSSNTYLSGYLGKGYGKDSQGEELPLIAPMNTGIIGQISSQRWQLIGMWTQYQENRTGAPAYGQSPTKAYGIGQIITRYKTSLGQAPTTFQLTADNITNTQFIPYNAWNQLPGMGRNIILTASIQLL